MGNEMKAGKENREEKTERERKENFKTLGQLNYFLYCCQKSLDFTENTTCRVQLV